MAPGNISALDFSLDILVIKTKKCFVLIKNTINMFTQLNCNSKKNNYIPTVKIIFKILIFLLNYKY